MKQNKEWEGDMAIFIIATFLLQMFSLGNAETQNNIF